MVTLKNKDETIIVDMLGEVIDIPTKKNYTVITGIYGNDKESYTRFTKDINVRVDYLSENNIGEKKDKRGSYKELVALFIENDFVVEDTETGEIYRSYYISGGTIALEKSKDYDNNKYFRTGTLPMKAL